MVKDKRPSSRKQTALVRPLLDTVLELSRLQASEPELQPFLDRCVEKIADITDVKHIKVMRYRPLQGDLLMIAGVGWHDGAVGNATLPIDVSSPPGRVIQTGHSSVVEDFTRETEFKLSPLLSRHDIRSLVNVPVKANGAVWGVLEADSAEPCDFSEDIITFLKTMAYMIGAAVQRDAHKAAAEDVQTAVTRETARRDTLLTEMHHRVKNNFQIIISTLLIQRRRAQAAETKQVLQTMANRVMAISLAHDQLDPRQTSQSVSIPGYLGALCRTIGQLADDVTIETNFDDGSLAVEKAVALGLAVNELVTNALKHAFSGPGSVRVTFNVGAGDAGACLCVSDDGKGMGAKTRDGSSGLAIVEALARELNGRVECETLKRGTTVRIRFRMTQPEPGFPGRSQGPMLPQKGDRMPGSKP